MLSPGQIVAQAKAEEWKAIVASDLLVMELEPDTRGKERRVTIQLMPPPFSQGWVRNIRKLAAAHWWDGTSINRVQDNYVVQWGDAGHDNPVSGDVERKPLPEGLEVMSEGDYVTKSSREMQSDFMIPWKELASQYPIGKRKAPVEAMRNVLDNYAKSSSHFDGWPLAGRDDPWLAWPIHCYGAVGVGRGLSPDTGSGAELYTVIGHAPRHLDRNIAVVGRIVEGMHHLSSLPRGFGPLGFYESAEERVPIQSIRLASELPEAERPRFEYLSTESESFAKYANRRANREPPFFIKPAGGADICNIPVPVKRVTTD